MENVKNSEILKQNTPKIPQNASEAVSFPVFSSETVSVLKQIKTQMLSNPTFLDDPRCYYSPDSKAFLREIFQSRAIDPAVLEAEIDTFFGDKQVYDRIISDLKRAYMNLANQMTKLEAGKNLEDTIAFTKGLTGLQERILTIQEKAEGLRDIHKFKNTVLEVIASQLTPDQRTGIIESIEAITKS